MDFIQAQDYFEQLNKFGSVLGLDSIRELLKRLGNPERKLNVVHVAGTNGKGSTIAFIESILREAGFKVGVYTSPVVFDYLEKIKINGEYISEDDFSFEAEVIKKANDTMIADGYNNPTIFESETAMAFDFFERKKCDIVIIETGMGGATDATNVCDKVLCSVITSISMDHTAFLGETIEEIAKVKAGIIKAGCPVALMKQDGSIRNVIRAVCIDNDTNFSETNKPYIMKSNLEGTVFNYKSASNGILYEHMYIQMLGSYQPDNSALAIEVAEILDKEGYKISKENIREGLKKASWRGRFEKINDNPLIFIDGAHNPGASERLKESIDLYFENYSIVYIMGVLADKDYVAITEDVLSEGEAIYAITPHNTRGLHGQRLAEAISKVNKRVFYKELYSEAIKAAIYDYRELEKAGRKSVIIAFGSLSYLGELKRALKEINKG